LPRLWLVREVSGHGGVLIDEVHVQIADVPAGYGRRTFEISLGHLGKVGRKFFGSGVQGGYIHNVSSRVGGLDLRDAARASARCLYRLVGDLT
jgi:hypothetical protein